MIVSDANNKVWFEVFSGKVSLKRYPAVICGGGITGKIKIDGKLINVKALSAKPTVRILFDYVALNFKGYDPQKHLIVMTKRESKD